MPKIRYMLGTCGRCGEDVCGANVGGAPWLHLAGEPQDGHFVHHGVLLSPEELRDIYARSAPPPADEGPQEQEPYPPPTIPGRDATEDEIGTSKRLTRRRIVDRARAAGFVVVACYSQGWWPDQWGRPARLADGLGIAGRHEDGRAFHCWWATKSNGEWEFQSATCAGVTDVVGQDRVVKYVETC